jgi:hypothetical protein
MLTAGTYNNWNHGFQIMSMLVQVLEKKSSEYYVQAGKAKYSPRKTGWPLKYAS